MHTYTGIQIIDRHISLKKEHQLDVFILKIGKYRYIQFKHQTFVSLKYIYSIEKAKFVLFSKKDIG